MVVLFGMTTFYVLRKSFFFANLKVENSSIGLVERVVYQLLTKGVVKLKQKHLVHMTQGVLIVAGFYLLISPTNTGAKI